MTHKEAIEQQPLIKKFKELDDRDKIARLLAMALEQPQDGDREDKEQLDKYHAMGYREGYKQALNDHCALLADGNRAVSLNDVVMDRLISEQVVLDAICKVCAVEVKPSECRYRKGLFGGCKEYEVIKAIPSAEPKTGYWITKPHIYGVAFCSECDFELRIDNTNYCPNCGVRMDRYERSERE